MTVAARPASQRRSLSPPAVRPSMRALTSPPPQTRSERRASAHPASAHDQKHSSSPFPPTTLRATRVRSNACDLLTTSKSP